MARQVERTFFILSVYCILTYKTKLYRVIIWLDELDMDDQFVLCLSIRNFVIKLHFFENNQREHVFLRGYRWKLPRTM